MNSINHMTLKLTGQDEIMKAFNYQRRNSQLMNDKNRFKKKPHNTNISISNQIIMN